MAETKKTTKPTTKPAVKPVVMAPKRDVHQIDAAGRAVGRIATEVGSLLRGKDRADFERHLDAGSSVVVSNVSQMTFSGKKIQQKEYFHFSGYPGGLKRKKLSDVFAANPGDVLRRAVWNMLPKNKLRDQMIKRLIIKK